MGKAYLLLPRRRLYYLLVLYTSLPTISTLAYTPILYYLSARPYKYPIALLSRP